MIRTLAVSVVLLVAAGMGSPLVASAQNAGQGQALGILFLLGASKTSTPTNAKAAEQKPKPRIASVKPTPLAANDRNGIVRVGSGLIAPTDGSSSKHN